MRDLLMHSYGSDSIIRIVRELPGGRRVSMGFFGNGKEKASMGLPGDGKGKGE